MKVAAAMVTVIIVFATVTTEVSSAQGICNMTQDGFAACKPACSIGIKLTAAKPTDACCTALSHADLACLCTYKTSPLLTYLRIDPKLAMALPAKCNITTSDLQC